MSDNHEAMPGRNDTLAIGAMTPINRLLEAPIFTEGALSILKETAALHSTHLIRNRATLGGNLCTGWPTADFSLPLLVLNAVLIAVGASDERPIPIDRFFTGANLTDLHSDALLKEIQRNNEKTASRRIFQIRLQGSDKVELARFYNGHG
jgi:CO/xanthine dehydrogenase FAD-binding subunit